MDLERYSNERMRYPNFKIPGEEETYNYRLLERKDVPKWVTYVKKIKKDD